MKTTPVRISIRAGAAPRFVCGAALGLFAVLAAPRSAPAREPAAFAAHAGADVARAAATSWAKDAVLIYVENDEDVDDLGACERWGYLFYSPAADKARAYSVRGGRILVAENLEMKFEAPPIAADWIDSGAALAAAERGPARAFRQKHQGQLRTMLLMRGALDEADPDPTTWMLVYTAPNAPSLFVVVDAGAGKVRRTWRG